MWRLIVPIQNNENFLYFLWIGTPIVLLSKWGLTWSNLKVLCFSLRKPSSSSKSHMENLWFWYAEVNEKFNCFVRPGHFSTVSQSFHLVKEFHMDKACEERQCGKEGWNKFWNILLSFCCFIWLLRSKYVTLFEIMQSTLSYHAGVKTNLDSTKCQTLWRESYMRLFYLWDFGQSPKAADACTPSRSTSSSKHYFNGWYSGFLNQYYQKITNFYFIGCFDIHSMIFVYHDRFTITSIDDY